MSDHDPPTLVPPVRATGALVDPEIIPPERRRERARQGLRMAIIEAQRAGMSNADIEGAVRGIHAAEQEPRPVTIRWDAGGHEPTYVELNLLLHVDGRVTWR